MGEEGREGGIGCVFWGANGEDWVVSAIMMMMMYYDTASFISHGSRDDLWKPFPLHAGFTWPNRLTLVVTKNRRNIASPVFAEMLLSTLATRSLATYCSALTRLLHSQSNRFYQRINPPSHHQITTKYSPTLCKIHIARQRVLYRIPTLLPSLCFTLHIKPSLVGPI